MQEPSWADPEGGRGSRPPWKITKNRVSKQYWSGSPEKSQIYQASIQCWAIIRQPVKRHLNRVSLADRWLPAYCGIFDPPSPHQLKEKNGCQSWTPSDITFWIRAWHHRTWAYIKYKYKTTQDSKLQETTSLVIQQPIKPSLNGNNGAAQPD